MLPLSSGERRALRAKAHVLAPVVTVSSAGLSGTVLAEIDRALTAHELIKVKTVSDEREERDLWLESICQRLAAAPVQHIGKVLVIYRPRPLEKKQEAGKKRAARPRGPRKTKKQMLASG